jgi:hypothetical protein
MGTLAAAAGGTAAFAGGTSARSTSADPGTGASGGRVAGNLNTPPASAAIPAAAITAPIAAAPIVLARGLGADRRWTSCVRAGSLSDAADMAGAP